MRSNVENIMIFFQAMNSVGLSHVDIKMDNILDFGLASELSSSGLKGAAFVLQVIQQDFKSSEPKDRRRIDFKVWGF